MKSLATIALASASVFCLWVGAGATALAAVPPEYGRCLHLVAGKYSNAACTEEGETIHERWEWYPIAGGEKPLEAESERQVTFTKEEEFVFQSAEPGDNAEFKCGKIESATAVYSAVASNRLENIALHMSECFYHGVTQECNNTGESGKVDLTLEGVLGVWKREPEEKKNKIGLDVFPPSGEEIGDITCSYMGKTVKIAERGSVIGQELETPVNQMTKTTKLRFERKGTHLGVQKPEHFEAGEPETPLSEARFEEGLWYQSSLNWFVAQHNAVELELRAGVN
jgi:hypothetical protein